MTNYIRHHKILYLSPAAYTGHEIRNERYVWSVYDVSLYHNSEVNELPT